MNRLAPDRAAFLPRIESAPLAPSRSLGLLTAAAGRTVLPLGAVEIRARVAARIASVSLVQTFRNAGDDALEALYIFPLPGGAAIGSLEMAVGDRVIRAAVQERKAARASYERAVDRGHRGALLEQERDGVFTMSVGNVAPGETVAVRLTYVERLPSFDDGRTEIRLPLVVAPRYIPGGVIDRADQGQGVESDTDVVADASRISPPRLAPGLDPAVALSVEVELSSGGEGLDPVDDLECSQHATRLSGGSFGIRVALAREGERLDRDFVLRWRAAPEKAQASLLCARGPDGARYGMLTLAAPRAEHAKAAARDVVLLLDISYSMQGQKLASAVRAAAFLVETLGPDDRFEVVLFCATTQCMNGSLIPADEAGIAKAGRFLRAAALGGGTELDPALERGLSILNTRGFASEERQGVLLLITDGDVGDEGRILSRLKKGLKRSRLFAVGIDTAVNVAFLQRMTKIGNGSSMCVVPGQRVEDALRSFSREIGSPFASDLSIEDKGAGIESATLAPERLPDLFAGRAATGFVRLSARQGGRIRVSGKLASGGAFDATAEARDVDLPAIALLWAKAHVQDLEDRGRVLDARGRAALEKEITALAVAHGLVTPFTSFVALDTAEVVKGVDARRTMVQPVEQPAGWADAGPGAMPPSISVSAMPAPASAPKRTRLFAEEQEDVQAFRSGPPAHPKAPPPACPAAPAAEAPRPPLVSPRSSEDVGGYGSLGRGGMAGSGGPALTAAGMTLGTVVYMSPEQLMGRDLGPTSDVYSAGVVLYEALTGRLPFHHENEMHLMKQIMKDAPPAPRSIRAEIPEPLEAAVLCALEKDRGLRFGTPRELADMLLKACGPSGTIGAARDGSVAGLVEVHAEPAPEPRSRTTIREVGGYRLDERIGEDGTGVTYAATSLAGGARVHVLDVHPNLVKSDAIRARMRKGAEAAMRLAHPGLARVLEVIETPDGLYCVLEVIEGITLESLIEETGALPPETAIAIMVAVLHALGALHEARLLHRDLAPDRIVLTTAGVVKVLTMGTAVPRGRCSLAWPRPFTRPIPPPDEEAATGARGTLWSRVRKLFTGGA